MVRVVKEADVRRNEILDVAQQLFYANGYEQTSIQDIIKKVGIAKGTFYHYFSAKLDLLDALIERMFNQILEVIKPIVNDDQLNAPEKFGWVFTSTASWKLEQKDFFLGILQVWHADNNAIFRQKLKVATRQGVVPLLTEIIRQGLEEGVFATDYPDDLAEIVILIGQSLSESLGELLLNLGHNEYDPALIERKIRVYEHAIERVLGAPSNSLKLFDAGSIKSWFE